MRKSTVASARGCRYLRWHVMHWLIGDIQGCAREFESLLRAIAFDPARDQLWCLGDLINRGPDNLATLRLWRDVGGQAVLGNHDLYALHVYAGRWPRKQDTLDDLFLSSDCTALLQRLAQMPILHGLDGLSGPNGQPVWLVHAGVHPAWHGNLAEVEQRIAELPVGGTRFLDPDVRFATTVRCCTDKGDRSRHDGIPEECPAPYQAWDSFCDGTAFFAHGHWAWRGHYRAQNSIGLDSGCVYGGKLTAYCVEEDRVVQVPGPTPR